jgi:hypothetical protein
MTQDILYADKFVKLTKMELAIYSYYFPIATSLVVPIDHISAVQDGLSVNTMGWKTWGMALSKIWWALDTFRTVQDNKNTVIITLKDDWCAKGFSIEDPSAFWQVVEELHLPDQRTAPKST